MADTRRLAVMPAVLTTPSQGETSAAQRRKKRQEKQGEKKSGQSSKSGSKKKSFQPPGGPMSEGTMLDMRRGSSMSHSSQLSGWQLARTAFTVTRRLSMSAYMVTQKDESREPSEHSIKIVPINANYEPTYRTEPKPGETFSGSMVKQIVDRLLGMMLDSRKYEAEECPRLTCSIANMVTSRLKDLHMPRYKIVCNVIMGQKQSQGVQLVSRCIWNPNTDTFINTSYENPHLYAVVSVHGVYLD